MTNGFMALLHDMHADIVGEKGTNVSNLLRNVLKKKKKRKKRWVDGQIEEWMCDRTSKTSVEECRWGACG